MVVQFSMSLGQIICFSLMYKAIGIRTEGADVRDKKKLSRGSSSSHSVLRHLPIAFNILRRVVLTWSDMV